MAIYYYRHAHTLLGPLKEADLQRLSAMGVVVPAGEVMEGADGQWQPASRLQHLLARPAGESGLAPVESEVVQSAPAQSGLTRAESERAAFVLPPRGAPRLGDHYAALRSLVSLLKVLKLICTMAVIAAPVAGLGGTIMLDRRAPLAIGMVSAACALAGLLILSLTIELVRLLIDLEANTRRSGDLAARLLERIRSEQG